MCTRKFQISLQVHIAKKVYLQVQNVSYVHSHLQVQIAFIFDNSEIETLEFETSEFENSKFETLEFEHLEFEISEFGNWKFGLER